MFTKNCSELLEDARAEPHADLDHRPNSGARALDCLRVLLTLFSTLFNTSTNVRFSSAFLTIQSLLDWSGWEFRLPVTDQLFLVGASTNALIRDRIASLRLENLDFNIASNAATSSLGALNSTSNSSRLPLLSFLDTWIPLSVTLYKSVCDTTDREACNYTVVILFKD